MLCLALMLAMPSDPAFQPSVFGLELAVKDVARAERSYVAAFGFDVRQQSGEFARLVKDGLELVLMSSPAAPAPEGSADVHLNLEVDSIAAVLERALAAGFAAPELEPHPIPIGSALKLVDPDGYALHLLDLAPADEGSPARCTVFNLGLNLEPGADWEFVERLGFEVFSRAYLPEALPIVKAGAAELVLHRGALAARPAGARAAGLLLGVPALESALAPLAELGFLAAHTTPRATPLGRRVALVTPSNVRVELLERSPAQLGFERLAALAGTWEGRSSAGWVSRSEIELIARGSVVVERTNFEAHPGETMLTLFHRDNEALVLTHYCVAGNQPRLVARVIEDGRLHFTFRDGGNLVSRDQGHMDEALFELDGPDAFSSKWSFFQGGRTSWMEEIHYRRVAPERGQAAAPK